MSAGEFITSFLDAVAWPTVVLVTVLLFKQQIGERIRRLTRANVGGQEFEFANEVNQLSRVATELGDGTEGVGPDGGGGGGGAPSPPGERTPVNVPAEGQQTLNRATEFVNEQPKESMVAAFEPVKTMILDAAKDSNVVVVPSAPVHEVLNNLPIAVDDKAVQAVKLMEGARNDALRIDGPIPQQAARNYVSAAQTVAQNLAQQIVPPTPGAEGTRDGA